MVTTNTRKYLDIVSTVAILTTCGFIALKLQATPETKSRAPQDIPVPKQPVSVAHLQSKGSPSATIVMLEYEDFQCDACGRFSTGVLPRLVADYVNKGIVELKFQHFPLQSIHPFALKASIAATCSGMQDRFWEMHDLMFANQRTIDDSHLNEWATTVGLDTAEYQHCLNNANASDINDGVKVATALGINSTPSFLIGHRTLDGRLAVVQTLRGARRYEDFVAAFDSTLKLAPGENQIDPAPQATQRH